jgi:SanA protein
MPLLTANLIVLWSASRHIYDEKDAPARTWAIVPGTYVENGWPGTPLRARLAPAAELLKRGVVERVLVSGRVYPEHDEPAAMRAYLESLGVPSEKIIEDRAGDRTFLTARNARDVFGIRDAIVCTNPFHLARSVFLLRRLGVDAVGVRGRPLPRLNWNTRRKWAQREALARVLAVWDTTPAP